jgi:hypothetical protein
MCSLLSFYSEERGTKTKEQNMFFVDLFFVLSQDAQYDRHVALYACMLPTPRKTQRVGALSCWLPGRVRSLLTVKPFGDASAELHISSCRLQIGFAQFAICNMQCRFGHYFEGAPPEGVTGGSAWQPAALVRQDAWIEEVYLLYLPPFPSISAAWLPGPGDGGPTHRLRPSRPYGPRSV